MKENDIEEARERLEKRLKDIWFSTIYSQEQEEKDLKILLLDYKRVLKINEVLLKENEELKEKIREHTLLISPYYVKENYIPVQKVKDKISERQFELQQEYKDFEDDAILMVLQELLEGRK